MAIDVEYGTQVKTANFDGRPFAEVRPDVSIKTKYASSIFLFTTLGALERFSLDSQSDPNAIWC